MDWDHSVSTRRRGPEWKRGWKDQTLAGIATPPPPSLLTIFSIVILLLWVSHYTGYRAQFHQAAAGFQLFLILLPILLVFIFIASYNNNSNGNNNGGFFRINDGGGGGGGSFRSRLRFLGECGGIPWSMVILVMVLVVLVYNQSSFSLW